MSLKGFCRAALPGGPVIFFQPRHSPAPPLIPARFGAAVRRASDSVELDFRPAVKLFTPDADDGCELFFRVRSDVGPGILICAA